MSGTIKYLDLTLPTPEENLALDEALLDACDAGGEEVLRFWESPRHFVVLGFGRKISEEVQQAACVEAELPVLRRCSGGGTVLQGPGCLNYALVLRLEREAELQTVSGANRLIMERNRAGLAKLTNLNLQIQGHTDLTLSGVKFSGNAQRRKRQALLFHGTILYGFDIQRIERFLCQPRIQPEYRLERSHCEFLCTVEIAPERLKDSLKQAWQVHGVAAAPLKSVRALVETKYSRDAWNLRR